MFHDRPLDDAIDAGDVRIRGDLTRIADFLRRFRLPALRAAEDAA
jgi:hypothetical protein